MKLKLIAALAALVLSTASQADITGTAVVGGSDVLLSVWEQGAPGGQPDQSFTLDLGMTLTQYLNTVSSGNATLATLLPTDSTWSNFLASSDVGSLQWSVIAGGTKVPNSPTGVLLATANVGSDPTTTNASGFGFVTYGDVTAGISQVGSYISNLSGTVNPNEQVNLTGSAAYYQRGNLATLANESWNNGNAVGASNVDVWTATRSTGLSSGAAVMTELSGELAFTDVGGNYVLTVSAVPEAPGGAMALCGLVALRLLIARRRNAA